MTAKLHTHALFRKSFSPKAINEYRGTNVSPPSSSTQILIYYNPHNGELGIAHTIIFLGWAHHTRRSHFIHLRFFLFFSLLGVCLIWFFLNVVYRRRHSGAQRKRHILTNEWERPSVYGVFACVCWMIVCVNVCGVRFLTRIRQIVFFARRHWNGVSGGEKAEETRNCVARLWPGLVYVCWVCVSVFACIFYMISGSGLLYSGEWCNNVHWFRNRTCRIRLKRNITVFGCIILPTSLSNLKYYPLCSLGSVSGILVCYINILFGWSNISDCFTVRIESEFILYTYFPS